MQRVFRVVNTAQLKPIGIKTTVQFNRSVRRYGVVNPVLLAEVVDADGVIALAIVDGNRRVRAAKVARLPKVPAVVLKATTEQDRSRLTLMSNYMRSTNFHTESTAILALAGDENMAAQAARGIGLGPGKMQQLYRKITTMPEPVRQAMYEHRMPVTAATRVGGWPEGLQREVMDLLDRHHYLNTSVMKELRASYMERHPEAFDTAEPAGTGVSIDAWVETEHVAVDIPVPPPVTEADINPPVVNAGFEGGRYSPVPATVSEVSMPDIAGTISARPPQNRQEGEPALPNPDIEHSPHDRGALGQSEATGDRQGAVEIVPERTASRDLHVVDVPADAMEGSANRTAGTSEASVPESHSKASPAWRGSGPASATQRPPGSEPPAAIVADTSGDSSGLEGKPAADDGPERMAAYAGRLDEVLRKLAREGHELGVPRAVWVDRAMRAWDRAESTSVPATTGG